VHKTLLAILKPEYIYSFRKKQEALMFTYANSIKEARKVCNTPYFGNDAGKRN